MGCATGCVKYLVFIANLIFALGGLALLIIGILYKFSYGDATKVLPDGFNLAPILSIVIGAIIFVTAFLGCCGAVKESTCMLTTYAIILLTIFIVQVAIGIYVFLQFKSSNELDTTIRKDLDKFYNNYSQNREPIDLMQKFLHCCGLDGPDSFPNNNHLPASCCRNQEDNCSLASSQLYHEGCVTHLSTFVGNSSSVIAGVAFGVAALELIGAIFALCLSSSIKNSYRRSMYA